MQKLPGAHSPEVNRPGREAGHLPPSSAEINNAWSSTSTYPTRLFAWYTFKAQGQIYLYTYRVVRLLIMQSSFDSSNFLHLRSSILCGSLSPQPPGIDGNWENT